MDFNQTPQKIEKEEDLLGLYVNSKNKPQE